MRVTASSLTDEKGNIRVLKHLLAYLRPYSLPLLGMFLALILTSTSILGLGKGVQYLVDAGISKGNVELLNQALVFLLVITIVLALATFARFFLITFVGERVVADIRRDVFQHVIHLSPSFFETMKRGEILSRLTTDTAVLQIVIGSSLSIALRNILLFCGGLTLLMITSSKLTLYIMVVVPLALFPILFIGRKVRKLSRHSQDKIAEISAYAEESLNRIKTMQSYTREVMELGFFGKHVRLALTAAIKRTTLRAVLTAIVIILVFSSIGFVLWTGGHDVVAGRMTAGELTSFIFYSLVVAGSLGALSEVIGDLQRAAGSTERLIELLQSKSAIQEPAKPVALKTPFAGDITLEDLSFHYPSRKKRSLEHINLTIPSGKTIALVGPSGAGKSTVLELLLRFYDPQSGHIMLGKTNIKDVSLKSLRNLFALVSQDTIIFSGTAYENILYGNPKATKKEVMRAAQMAHATEFIEQLPEGFDTFLGEKGVRLSGGQKQRISIARAILKNPNILLLDEATSSLDSESEKYVQEALDQFMKDRTTIVIAHRLSTVLKADQIVVLDKGSIVETGTHTQLLKKKGMYAGLAKLQFKT